MKILFHLIIIVSIIVIFLSIVSLHYLPCTYLCDIVKEAY